MRVFAIALLVAASVQPALRSLVIEPAKANVQEEATMVFVAIATWSNGVRKNVSDKVAWSSGDGKVATVSGDGTVKVVGRGRVKIKATMGKLAARAELTVQPRPIRPATAQRVMEPFVVAIVPPTPVPQPEPQPEPQPQPRPAPPPFLRSVVLEPEVQSLREGESRQFKAWGRYSDGTVRDITDEAVWSSTDVGVATADYVGAVAARRYGTATIAATLDTHSGVAHMTVLPVIARIVIRPASFSIHHRARERLRAVAVLTDDSIQDITDRATWTSSDEAVALVRDGAIEGVAPGTATITVTYEELTASTPVTVAPLIESIAIQPQSASLAVGQIQQLTATATFSDGNTKDVTFTATWRTDSPAVRVSPSGLVTATAPGTATVKVRVGDVEGEARVDVASPPS